MWDEPTKYCEGWNFGPRAESISTVWDVATKVVKNYGSGELKDISDPDALHEAKLLMLDISKAKFPVGMGAEDEYRTMHEVGGRLV